MLSVTNDQYVEHELQAFGFFFVRLTHEKLMCSCILKEASCCQCLRFTLGDRQGLSQSQIFSVIREPTSVSLFRRARMRRVLLFVFSSFSVSSSPPAEVLNHRVKIALKRRKHLVESIKGQTVKKKNEGLFFARVLLSRRPFSLACFELNLSIFIASEVRVTSCLNSFLVLTASM